MSDMSKTIERLEHWVGYWEPHYPEIFIADLRALLATAKAAQRAAELLQRAHRFDAFLDNTGEAMERCSFGDWVLWDDVSQAIKILQEPTP